MINKFLEISEAQYQIFFGDVDKGRFRFYGKGRRFGGTHGAAIYIIHCLQHGKNCLWGDVIYSNISRYFQRYFEPFLVANNIQYKFNKNEKLLTINGHFCDFRSADNPLTWEGMAYDFTFLNEAGIILNDEYLYNNTILPMMMDNPNSQLVALGTPKIQQGIGLLFQELYERGVKGEPGFYSATYSSYDNPFLTKKSIDELKTQIPAINRDQEIYGRFVKSGGSVLDVGWFKYYDNPPAEFDYIVQSWDTASKPQQINDPSCGTTWGIIEREDKIYYYLLDVVLKRLAYPDLKREAIKQATKFNPDSILIEDKASGIALIQDLEEEDEFDWELIAIEPVGDKITRMSTASLVIENGYVFLPRSAPWLPAYIKELRVFPNKKIHDDQVDSTSQLLNYFKESPAVNIG